MNYKYKDDCEKIYQLFRLRHGITACTNSVAFYNRGNAYAGFKYPHLLSGRLRSSSVLTSKIKYIVTTTIACMLKRLSNLHADKVRNICIGPRACFSILIRILFHEHLCSDGIYCWYTISSHRSSSHESYLSACAWSLVQEHALKLKPEKDQCKKANL